MPFLWLHSDFPKTLTCFLSRYPRVLSQLSALANEGSFKMDTQEHVVPSAQHYSGQNRIPNIKQFMENLDRDKKHRDAQIDSQTKDGQHNNGEVQAHQNATPKKGKNRRTVRDPVTGKDVEIDDIDGSMIKEAQDPHVGFAD